MRLALANALSVIGHPLLALPAAVAFVLYTSSGRTSSLAPLGLVFVVVAAVFLYSLARVLSGHWRDTDASAQYERAELNLLIAPALAVATGIAWANALHPKLVVGLALACAIIVAALLTRTLFKLSLHVAFGVYAAFIVWPNIGASTTLIGLACAVGWARLALKRHTLIDIIAGALAGGAAGTALLPA